MRSEAANIKLTPDGTVKVDFGLAKLGRVGQVRQVGKTSPTLRVMATQAGMILGTAAYMAPEQARGTDRLEPAFSRDALSPVERSRFSQKT